MIEEQLFVKQIEPLPRMHTLYHQLYAQILLSYHCPSGHEIAIIHIHHLTRVHQPKLKISRLIIKFLKVLKMTAYMTHNH